MAKLINQLFDELQPAVSLMEPTEDHQNTHGCLTSLRNKNNLGNFQHQYLPELLVNVYSYCVMVKVCLSVVCVKTDFSQI